MQAVDQQRLSQLLDQHGPALVLYADQWCDSPEDAVQEAFIRLMGERPGGVELSFFELRDIESAEHTPEEWSALFHQLAPELLKQLSRSDSSPLPTAEQLEERCRQKLPDARQALVANGVNAREVDAMSTHQVALLYSLQTYHEIIDDALKYFRLPYPLASAGMSAVAERAQREEREIIPIAELILPAIQAAKSATTRNERGIAVLRLIEALRIYGATHNGKLPDRLEDITEVPLPIDPVTGEPFQYSRDGESARIHGPTFGDVPLNYEITMAPAPADANR